MKRRSNNQGSVIERSDGRWEARISLPHGKRKSSYAKTRKDAEKKLREMLTDLDKGIVPTDGRQTINQFLIAWLEVVELQVEPSTFINYRTHVRRLLKDLGDISLSKFTAQHLQSFYVKRISQGLAASTLNVTHMVIKSALNHAMTLNLVSRNAADSVKPPKSQAEERVPLSEAQARALLHAAKGNRLQALYILVLATGMREGELLALEWKDIDFERGELHLIHGLQMIAHGFRVTRPKSPSSRRTILLPAYVVTALEAHRECQQQERQLAGEKWDASSDFVFTNLSGRKILPHNFRRHDFARLLKRADLPHMHFHDLRHTAATLLLRRGVNIKVVSEMLGHANVGITLHIYAHVIPGMQQQAADVASQIFGEGDK